MRRGASSRYYGISKSIKSHSFRGSSRRTDLLHPKDQLGRTRQTNAKRATELHEMSLDDRQAANCMFADNDTMVVDSPPTVSLGQQSIDSSHEGGEYADFQDLAEQVMRVSGARYVDPRTRTDRVEIRSDQWNVQMDRLVDTYLDYRARDTGSGMPSSVDDTMMNEGPPLLSIANIELIDIFSRRYDTLAPRPHHIFPNETLVHYGFLGCSPLFPTVAISLRTLSAFRQLHRTCPRLSSQAQARALCHMHDVPYRPYLATQLAIAYDVYLDILDRIEVRLKKALNRHTPDWRLLNDCPACSYKLEDKPALDFEWLVSIDGNSSLKRWDSKQYGVVPREDSRQARSDLWLSEGNVNRFQHEVKAKPNLNDDWEDEPELEDDPRIRCADRWRNAGPEHRKQTLSVFHESGIFIATCRHRFVLLVCDMIKSGELAKYPLAVVDKLLSVYGVNGGCAYDIGCTFASTLKTSSLGLKAVNLKLRMMVGSFHGHAHNRQCQLDWHPMYITGIGRTEGEGCEHVFSSSNDLARTTRHATQFHRQQAIEEHFKFWNEDKYALLSNYLDNHYREASEMVHTLSIELDVLRTQLSIIDDDFSRFHEQERQHLHNLKQPSPEDQLRIRYVSALDELVAKKEEWSLAREGANNALTEVHFGDFQEISLSLNRARAGIDGAYERLQHAEALVGHIQNQLGLEHRWEIGGEEYSRFKEEAMISKYRIALNELERLVVMRLFELSKLGLSGTGYKLRQQINKALQRRSEAVRKAITRYNMQAAALNPPRPKISWKEIADYSFLGEFDLLRLSRADIRSDDWAKPVYREATVKYFKLCRAREELTRVEVEVRRLRTAIHHEEEEVREAVKHLTEADPKLGVELQRQHHHRAAVNAIHIHRLNKIEASIGYAGRMGLGIRRQAACCSAAGSEAVAGSVVHGTRPSPPLDEDGSPRNADNFTSPPPTPSDLGEIFVDEFGDTGQIERDEETLLTEMMADYLNDLGD